VLGPPGLGLQTFAGSSILNPLAGVPGVPLGRPLNFTVPTLFTGADLMSILPGVRTSLTQGHSNADSGLQAIQVNKQASSAGVFPADYRGPGSALETSAGLQRTIVKDFVVSADFAYRALHPSGSERCRKRYRPKPIQYYSPGPSHLYGCSSNRSSGDLLAGPINVHEASARATYKGLLLRAEKRFSHGLQVLGSYAYSTTVGTNVGNGFNLDKWLQDRARSQPISLTS
jgi:hypothetical protein